jgi:hypothetical protein
VRVELIGEFGAIRSLRKLWGAELRVAECRARRVP